jgi:amino acid transporter
MQPKSLPNKPLSFFNIIMISTIAVDSLRTLTMGAKYGFSLLFFYIIIGLVFFIPTILISAELATGWPNTGGAYIWVREAFGTKCGLFAIWLQWVYNLAWFPTIFAFISATLTYLIDPALANNKEYMLLTILGFFWASTIICYMGVNTASWISTIGALIGTLLPMGIIICLGFSWVLHGNPMEISFSIKSFTPDITSIDSLTLLSSVLFGFIGIEVSAVHAGDVANPGKNYPRALAVAGIIIFLSLVLSSLAITVVIPASQISLTTGLIDAFSLFFKYFHMAWFIPVIVFLIVLGSLSGVNTWVLAPARSLLIASQDFNFATFLQKTNNKNMPTGILFAQGIIVSILSCAFLLMPSVNSTYWVLSALTTILALPYYILLFAAAIMLRYKMPDIARAYKIPGGNITMWICGLTGIFACIAAILIGFIPPSQVHVGNITSYELILGGGTLLLSVFPLMLIYATKKRGLNNAIVTPAKQAAF